MLLPHTSATVLTITIYCITQSGLLHLPLVNPVLLYCTVCTVQLIDVRDLWWRGPCFVLFMPNQLKDIKKLGDKKYINFAARAAKIPWCENTSEGLINYTVIRKKHTYYSPAEVLLKKCFFLHNRIQRDGCTAECNLAVRLTRQICVESAGWETMYSASDLVVCRRDQRY